MYTSLNCFVSKLKTCEFNVLTQASFRFRAQPI